MSEHDQFDEAVAAYAIGAFDRDERAAFEHHLASCEICRAALADLDRVAASLGLSTEAVEPPATLKSRTLARATAQPQDRPLPRPFASPVSDRKPAGRPILSMQWLAAAAAVVMIAGLGVYAWSLRSQVMELRTVVADASARVESLRVELFTARRDSTRLANTVSVLGSVDLIRVDLHGAAPAPQALGRAFISKTHGLMFNVGGLPALPAGQIYQLWLIPNGAAPVSAGVFTVDPSGASNVLLPLTTGGVPVKTVAVTREPGPAGSPGPTSPIVLVGTVGA